MESARGAVKGGIHGRGFRFSQFRMLWENNGIGNRMDVEETKVEEGMMFKLIWANGLV